MSKVRALEAQLTNKDKGKNLFLQHLTDVESTPTKVESPICNVVCSPAPKRVKLQYGNDMKKQIKRGRSVNEGKASSSTSKVTIFCAVLLSIKLNILIFLQEDNHEIK